MKCDNDQKTVKTTLYAAILCAALCGAAQAQTWEVGVSAGYPRLRYGNLGSISLEQPADNDTGIRPRYTQGVSITYNTKGYYGVELGCALMRARAVTTVRNTVNGALVTSTEENTFKMYRMNADFLAYWMPRSSRWRPYFAGGFQGYQYSLPRIAYWPDKGTRTWGGNFGIGIKVVPLKHTLFRLDFRDYFGGTPWNLTFSTPSARGSIMHQFEGSAGFSFTF
jgi:hypothetical protein